MKILFDTSVLVCAVVDQLPLHRDAFKIISSLENNEFKGVCSTHVLAETYATLTSLPLPTKIKPVLAQQLIEVNFASKLEVVDLTLDDYRQAIGMVARLGLQSGIIYDALHLQAAEKSGCQKLCTFNLKHFLRFASISVEIYAP